LGLCPRPHWGSFEHSRRPLAGLGVGPPGERERGRGGVPEFPNPELASLIGMGDRSRVYHLGI